MELEDKLRSLKRLNLIRGRDVVPPKEKKGTTDGLNGTIIQNGFGEFVLVRKIFDPCKLHPINKLSSSSDIGGNFLSRILLSNKNQKSGARGLRLGISSSFESQVPNPKPQAPSHNPPFDLKDAVFIDCETTGLAGGVGTYAFLVGLGYLSGEEFWVEQYFMQDFHQERAVLSAVAERLSGFKFLVSFNGKCYDLPLLENRFLINRLDFDSSTWAHLDLLFPSRRIWKRRLGECSLSNLERRVLGVQREIDVPSFMVPQIYFDYLRSGEVEPLIPVFHHNAFDVLSLLRLSFLIDQALHAISQGEDFNFTEFQGPEDLYSLGRIHYDLGDYQACERCLKQALSDKLEPEWRLSINAGLALVYKKTGQIQKAKEIWHHLVEGDFPFSISAHEELAKYYEHRMKDYHHALLFVEKTLSQLRAEIFLSNDSICSYDTSRKSAIDCWEYRKSRLQRKAQKTIGQP